MSGKSRSRMFLNAVVFGMIAGAFAGPVFGDVVRDSGLSVELPSSWKRLDQAEARDRAERGGDPNQVLGTWQRDLDGTMRCVLAKSPEATTMDHDNLAATLSDLAGVGSVTILSTSHLDLAGQSASCADVVIGFGDRVVHARVICGEPWLLVFTVEGEWCSTHDAAVETIVDGIEADRDAPVDFDEAAAHWLWLVLFSGVLGMGWRRS